VTFNVAPASKLYKPAGYISHLYDFLISHPSSLLEDMAAEGISWLHKKFQISVESISVFVHINTSCLSSTLHIHFVRGSKLVELDSYCRQSGTSILLQKVVEDGWRNMPHVQKLCTNLASLLVQENTNSCIVCWKQFTCSEEVVQHQNDYQHYLDEFT